MSQLTALHDRAKSLRVYLDELITADRPVAKFDPALPEYGGVQMLESLELDLVVTHVEVNGQHGTGILMKRMFPDTRRILHTWTCQAYGRNDFGAVQLFVSGWRAGRYNMYRKTLAALKPYQLRRIVCVPFDESDLHLALAMKDARELPLLIYVMDDQNLTTPRISDALLREAFAKAAVVFAISPEMRDAYSEKFGVTCFVLPPLVSSRDVCSSPVARADIKESGAGILLGNIWNAEWLEEIRHVLRGSGVRIDWYGNAGGHVKFDPDALAKDGLVFKGSLPEAEICSKMREYQFGVLPSSPDDKEDWLAKYSIPTRLVTSVAAGNLPMIVIGSESSASSRFVRRFGVGEVCSYRSEAFATAVANVTGSDAQTHLRTNAARAAGLFSDDLIAEWLWRSLDACQPADDRFEDAFRSTIGEVTS